MRGFNGTFRPENFSVTTVVTCQDNIAARIYGTSLDSNFLATNHFPYNAEEVGITLGAKKGQYLSDGTALVASGATGGARIGPDFVALNAMRDKVEAGDVR